MARKKKTKAVTAKQKKDKAKLDCTASQSDNDAAETDVLNTSESSDFTLSIDDSDLVIESGSTASSACRIAKGNNTLKRSGSPDKILVSEASSPITVADTIVVNLAEDFSPVKTPSSLKLPSIDMASKLSSPSRSKAEGSASLPLVEEIVPQENIILEEEAIIEETMIRSATKRRDSESSEEYDYPVNDEIEQINIEEMIGGVGPSTESAYLLYDSVLNSALRSSEVGCNIVIEACDVDEIDGEVVRTEETPASVEFDEIVQVEGSSLTANIATEPGPLQVMKKEGDTFYPAKVRREKPSSVTPPDDVISNFDKVIQSPVTRELALHVKELSVVPPVISKGKNIENKCESPSYIDSKSKSPPKTLIIGKPVPLEQEKTSRASEILASKESTSDTKVESFIEKFDVRNAKQCVVRLQDCLTDDAKSISKTSPGSDEPMDTSDPPLLAPAVHTVASSDAPDSVPPKLVNEEEISSRVSEMSLEKVKNPIVAEVKSRPCRTRGAYKKGRLLVSDSNKVAKLPEEPMDIDTPSDEELDKSVSKQSIAIPSLKENTSVTESIIAKPLPEVPSGISLFKVSQPTADSLKPTDHKGDTDGTSQVNPGVLDTKITKPCGQLSRNEDMQNDDLSPIKVSGITKLESDFSAVSIGSLHNKPSEPTSGMENIVTPGIPPEPTKPTRPRRQIRQPKRIAEAVKPKATAKAQASKVTPSPKPEPLSTSSKRPESVVRYSSAKQTFAFKQFPDSPIPILDSVTNTPNPASVEIQPCSTSVKSISISRDQSPGCTIMVPDSLEQVHVSHISRSQSAEELDKPMRTFQRPSESPAIEAAVPSKSVSHKLAAASPKPPAASPKPTAASPKQTAASVKPTAASAKPTAASVKPTAASPKPTAASVKPTAASPKPTLSSPRPTAASPKPTAVAAAPKPVAAALKSVAVASKSVTTAPKSVAVATKSVGAAIKSGRAATKSVAAANKPVPSATKPVAAVTKAIPAATNPVSEDSSSVAQATKPASLTHSVESLKPIVVSPKPTAASPHPDSGSLPPVIASTIPTPPMSSPPAVMPCLSPKPKSIPSAKEISVASNSAVVSPLTISGSPHSEFDYPKPVAPTHSEPTLFTPDVSSPTIKLPAPSKPPPSSPVQATSPKPAIAFPKTASPKRSMSPKHSQASVSVSPKRAPSPKPAASPKPSASPKPTSKASATKSITPAKVPTPKATAKNTQKTAISTKPPPITKAALKAFSPKPANKSSTAKAPLPKGAKGIAKAMAKLAMAKETSSKARLPTPEPMDVVREDISCQISQVDPGPTITTNFNGEDVIMKEEPPKSGKSPKTEAKKEAQKKPESTRRRSNRIKVNRWDEGPAIAAAAAAAAAAGTAVVPTGHGSAVASMPVSTATAVVSTNSPGTLLSQPSPLKEPSLSLPSPSSLPPPTFEPDKPVKVKSRWRRTSELEMGAGSLSSVTSLATPPNQAVTPDGSSLSPAATLPPVLSPTPPPLPPSAPQADLPPPPPPSTPPIVLTPKTLPFVTEHPEIEERLKNFEVIRENIYLTTRHRSKEAKKMVCECTMSEEEIARGEPGCGEDCLNRLLMIECSNRCVLGDLCSNKRFQNCEYSKCAVVRTEKKGLGLIASSHIPGGEFLMEYVGEVLDPKEFRRRAKEYSKEKNLHFYFMALKSDSIIDATVKGSISRFINHSCDPNAETQKWTVNGELRIGFFSKRPIAENEEVTFDYQLQRYGKEAQRCHCESANCRGWIGDEPDKEDKEEKDRNWEKAKDKREKKKNREELEEEIEKLRLSGIKNRAHTLMLNRLMVRAEDHSSRSQLLGITQADVDQRCLRLFLDYHGLNLLWSWMVDSTAPTSLKVQILDTFNVLPITNKTILQDSKVFGVVERWANLGNTAVETNTQREEDSSPDSEETSDGSVAVKGENKEDDSSDANDPDRQTLIAKATALHQTWVTLKEEFRIPKKERIEQMKEHEREADRGYVDHDKAVKSETSYDRHWSYDKENSRSKRRGRDSPDSMEWKSRTGRSDDRNGPLSHMSKMKRRHLFAMKVEEEERQKRIEEERWSNHQEQCYALGVDPSMAYPPQNNGYYHPLVSDGSDMPPDMFGPGSMGPPQRYPPPPPSPFMPGPCSPAFPPPFHPMGMGPPGPSPPLGPAPGMVPPQGLGLPPGMPGGPPGMVPPGPPGMVPPGSLPFGPPPPGVPFPPGGMPPPGAMPGVPPPGAMPPFSNGGMPPMPTPPQSGFPAPMFLPGAPPPTLELPPSEIMGASNPPLPTSVATVIVLKLPKNWKISLDKDRRVSYYYHTITRHTQWTFPSPENAAAEEAKCVGLKSSTKSSHADDSDESEEEEEEEESESEEEESSSDEYEEKEDEEDDEDYDDHLLAEARRKAQEELLSAETVIAETRLFEDPSTEVNSTDTNPLVDPSEPALKKKREGLVTVNIISPRDEEEDYRKGIKKSKIKETKMKLARQKARAKAKAAASLSGKSKKKAKTCEADTSSGPSRKIKDKFRVQMANVIVTLLNPYRKADCKIGRIVNTEDFKHLARKLTHFVMVKELRHIASIEDLRCNDNVKHKARDFIRKYMSKFGAEYSRSPDD